MTSSFAILMDYSKLSKYKILSKLDKIAMLLLGPIQIMCFVLKNVVIQYELCTFQVAL